MINIGIMLLVFLLLLFAGMPVAFVLSISSVVYCLISGNAQFLYIIGHNFFTGMDNFVLMAVPLFILTGEIMNKGDITNKLVDFANLLVGRFRGGLAYMDVLSCMFFAGITGSALSEVAALGSIMIPAMEKTGYDKEYSSAVTAAAAIQGPLIPPSIPAVLIAAVTGASTGALFIGAAIPGFCLGLACCLITYFVAKKRQYPKEERKFSLKEVLQLTIKSFFPLLTPFIIIGGLLTGAFTPTESAAISVFYSLIVTMIGYKRFTRKEFAEILKSTIVSTAMIYLIIGAASGFAWILAIENIPSIISDFLVNFSQHKAVTLLIINIFLLFWGMWMDTAPSIMILMPMLFPIANGLGIHPIHFGVIVLLNLMIGLLTPPFGMVLFSAQAVSRVDLRGLLRELKPFLLVDFVILGLVTFVPEISLFLPRLFGLIN